MTENSLKIYPANDGDSFLLNIEGLNILIDGGYVDTYNSYIKKDLQDLGKKGSEIDFLIVTHIDQDHISGVNKLLQENNDQNFIEIKNVWHNSLKHISGRNINKGNTSVSAIKNLSKVNHLKDQTVYNKDASAIQGSTLVRLILEGNHIWNKQFNGNAVSTDNLNLVQLNDKVRLRLLSPNNEKLVKLNRSWQKELLKNGYLGEVGDDLIFDEAFEVLISKQKSRKRLKTKEISNTEINIMNLLEIPFNEDTSASNGSSMAFVIESENKKILFLGDSHPSLVYDNFKEHICDEKGHIHFDVVKLSHHGSFSNNSPDLLRIIKSEQFIFSSNGKQGHPDEETIANVIYNNTKGLKLVFNYLNKSYNLFSNPSLMKKYGYKLIHGTEKQPVEIYL